MQANLPMGGNRITNLQDGTNESDAATVGQVNGAMPIGAVTFFAGTPAPPNWLFCYGQEVSRTSYADLFSVIGTTYGEGDGSTTFNLPDIRGNAIAGRDDMGGTAAGRLTGQSGGVDGTELGATGGAEQHTLTVDEMPEHDHGGDTKSAGSHTHEIPTASGNSIASGNPFSMVRGTGTRGETDEGVSSAPNHKHDIDPEGGDEPHNNVQPTIILNAIIKVR